MVILILIGIVPCIIATNVVSRSYKNRAVSLRESSVKNQCDILRANLDSEDYLNNLDSKVVNSELALLSNVYNGRIAIIDEDFKVVTDTYDIDIGKTSVSKEVISCLESGKGTSQYDDRNDYIIMTFPIEVKGQVKGVMLISVSTNEIAQNARLLENRGLTVTVIASFVMLILGYILAGILVRPFMRVTHAIEDVTDGYQDEAISVPDYTETMQITTAFNQMLSRVRAMDSSRQDFVSNVSHELKTPLTSMKVLADSLNGQDNVPVELYKEFMQDITQEIDRMNLMIQDLLTMVRLDKKAAVLNIERTDVAWIIEAILKRLKPIADKRSITLTFEKVVPVVAEVDASKLELALSNLIENAVKYNVDNGWVRVNLDADRKYFYVVISDSGVGIPEEEQEHIYERFYRGDKSHSTEIEGTGLGLAITKSVIVLLRGVIKVNSRPGEGSTFQVRIPLVRQT
ncbi:MAG: HAMP domain-containing histidine kinase [Lachnospiraceae bacterium]|nr:HAMP domain-containing histidine kinase [Lachnospiraceae bacterium]MBR3279043.1 HAMP domain-containing histidine kinase [Lachnospiraceae bacterium]